MTIPAAGAVIAGKFVLERPLARGGMGAVWVGRHRDLGVAVAVKFMDQSLIAAAAARIRFEREAKAAATLDTKHVVQVLDHGVVEAFAAVADGGAGACGSDCRGHGDQELAELRKRIPVVRVVVARLLVAEQAYA